MASLTAADLQRKREELEGAPDPFPSLSDSVVPTDRTFSKPKPQQSVPNQALDTGSEQAFPSLAPSATPAKVLSPPPLAWSASARAKAPAVQRTPVVTDSFTLDSVDLSTASEGKRAPSLSHVLRSVNTKFKVKVEASAQSTTGETTFILKGESARDVEKAKRHLIALLSPVETLVVHAPVSTIPGIIGPKGAFLNKIRDETGAKVEIPRRDAAQPTNGIHKAGSTDDDEQEEETVPITITASAMYAADAKRLIEAVIASKTSKVTQRVRNIPAHVLPFIAGRKTEFEALPNEGHATLTLQGADAVISGDRAAVAQVVTAIRAGVEDLQENLTTFKYPVPRRQHVLLTGKTAEDILNKAKCAVVLPAAGTQLDEVALWARAHDLPGALAALQQAASSQYVHSYDMPGTPAQAHEIFTYLTRTGYSNTLAGAHADITIHAPTPAHAPPGGPITVDILGSRPAVEAAAAQLAATASGLVGATRTVDVDWLVHRALAGRFAKQLRALHDSRRITVFFPPETVESSAVLLVHHGDGERKEALDAAQAEVLALAAEVADLRTETIHVDPRWHTAVLGAGGTTLNAIIGADSTLTIKLGSDAARLLKVAPDDATDKIVVRGVAADVARARSEIEAIVERAQNDEIDNSFVAEFTIAREYVGRIVGTGGAGVRKLRDTLGVQIDFDDEPDAFGAGEREGGMKRKKGPAPGARAKVSIRGRKENVEEAQRRILAQADKFADETMEVLKIPREYHSALIGRAAKYVMRLEDKYGVKITFPRGLESGEEGRTREPLKQDEVLVKGSRKGVAGAKKELLDAAEFEKESNNSVKFTVPARSVPRILGKGGASINEIKDNTGAEIDIDRGEDAAGVVGVTVRGTKQAVAEAKAAILKIASEVGEETTLVAHIESKYHRTLIGPRGQGLRDLIVKCGGPADTKAQAGLVHFPRPDEPSDEVRLSGPKAVVGKLKAELELAVTGLRDRVVRGAAVPATQHRAIIGRGGAALNALQERHSVQVQFPGSRSYAGVGDPENADELVDTDPENLVKVMGPRAGVDAAIAEMLDQAKAPAASAPRGNGVGGAGGNQASVEEAIEVPSKYHHAISQNGAFFRQLRTYGVQVDHSVVPPKPMPPRPPALGTEARIDDAEDTAGAEDAWHVIPNYDGVDSETATWTIRARDAGGLERARTAIEDARKAAEAATHIGFLTVRDRSVFPRIVGAKGANVARMRAETGADITVGRDDNTIVLIGSESAIAAAKEAILDIAKTKSRPRY